MHFHCLSLSRNSDRRWKIEQCKFSLCDLDVIIDAKNEDLSP